MTDEKPSVDVFELVTRHSNAVYALGEASALAAGRSIITGELRRNYERVHDELLAELRRLKRAAGEFGIVADDVDANKAKFRIRQYDSHPYLAADCSVSVLHGNLLVEFNDGLGEFSSVDVMIGFDADGSLIARVHHDGESDGFVMICAAGERRMSDVAASDSV